MESTFSIYGLRLMGRTIRIETWHGNRAPVFMAPLYGNPIVKIHLSIARHWFMTGVLLLCSAAASAFDASQLVGHWYGESERNGQQHRFLLTRNADGSFSMEYRIYVDNTMMVSRRQEGQWALKDGATYWTRTTKITDDTGSYPPPTTSGFYEDMYSIVELDNAHIKTRHQVSGSETVVKRAQEGFALK